MAKFNPEKIIVTVTEDISYGSGSITKCVINDYVPICDIISELKALRDKHGPDSEIHLSCDSYDYSSELHVRYNRLETDAENARRVKQHEKSRKASAAARERKQAAKKAEVAAAITLLKKNGFEVTS